MLRANKTYRKKFCSYCKEKSEPSYKETEPLKRFITERGKIISRAKTGTCAAHQRKATTAIKRARILALLPFAPKV
jgi:small subunit ribosomal protein S18